MANAGFGATYTLKDARNYARYQEEQMNISDWVEDERLDNITSPNQSLIDEIDYLLGFSENPGVHKELVDALIILRRLYVLREQLPKDSNKQYGFDPGVFKELVDKLSLALM